MTPHPSTLSLDRVREAASTIDPIFLNSPQYRSEPLSRLLNFNTHLKVEFINPIRSFKGRGADFCIKQLPRTQGIVCASAGNFGQGVAYSARQRNIPAKVFAATTANPLKIERMRSLGAEVITSGNDFDKAKDAARAFAEESGWLLIEDGAIPAIAEGAGTIALELLNLDRPLDALLIPLGNGALLSGITLCFRALSPKTQIIAVYAEGAPAMAHSIKAKRCISTESVNTICDGIAVRVPVPLAVNDIIALGVDDILAVTDDTVIESLQLLLKTEGLLVEPAGAVGFAAAMQHRDRFQDKNVGTILCGSNVTEEQMVKWFFPK